MSSNNGLNIRPLIDQYEPQHIIVKLYQDIELGGGGASYSVAQARTARERGCTVGGYVWLYAGIDGAHQVAAALDTAQKASITLGVRNPLFLDLETYTDGSFPSLAVAHQAIDECRRRGIPPAIYTAAWYWKGHMGNTAELGDVPLWAAQYDGIKTLESVALFGGWGREQVIAKQYSGNPVDRSVFNSAYATP